MPGKDGTGPRGQGPMTGQMGGNPPPAAGQDFGRGFGFGPCGLGLAWRRQFGAKRGLGRYFGWNWPQNPNDQKQALANYRQALEEELVDVKKEETDLNKA